MYYPSERGDDHQEFSAGVLLREPTSSSRSVHAPHPVLQRYTNCTAKTYLEINEIPDKALRTVDPATLLFQRPLNNIHVVSCAGSSAKLVIDCTGCLTFGNLLEELDKMRALRLHGDEWSWEMCDIRRLGVLASNAKVVLDARRARARA